MKAPPLRGNILGKVQTQGEEVKSSRKHKEKIQSNIKKKDQILVERKT